MKEKHKHQAAIDLLRTEMCKIGGELFEKEFVTLCLETRAEQGDEEAKKELNMSSFVEKMLGGIQSDDDKSTKFKSLLESILVLSKDT